jgi:hypothetical protein
MPATSKALQERRAGSHRDLGVLAGGSGGLLHTNSGHADQTLRGEMRTPMKTIGMTILGLMALGLLVACVVRFLKAVYGLSMD